MNMRLRDAALGAATMALLLYAAITAAKSVAGSLQVSPQTAICATAACQGAVQVARGKD
jgi:hypothetical protein